MTKKEKELTEALSDAFLLLSKNVDECKLDNPKFWRIKKVLEKQGKKTDVLSIYFSY